MCIRDRDEAARTLIGTQSGDRWQLGMKVRVRLLEAAPITGGLMFDMISEPKKGPIPKGRNLGMQRQNDRFKRQKGGLPRGVSRKPSGKKRR